MKSEEWRDEAVLNDVGLIWRGTYNRLKPVIWKYDQFEKDILDCALYLVHIVGKVKSSNRSDPVKTARQAYSFNIGRRRRKIFLE